MKLGMQVGLGPGHIALDGDPAPPPHLYCGQTAGCIKMSLGMEVGLSPGDFVLDGDPAPYPYAIGPLSVLSVTLVYCGQTVGQIKMKLGMQVGLGPGHIVFMGTQFLLPIFIVAKRLDASRCHLVRR